MKIVFSTVNIHSLTPFAPLKTSNEQQDHKTRALHTLSSPVYNSNILDSRFPHQLGTLVCYHIHEQILSCFFNLQ